ncbi:hypothetical protein ACFLU5_06025 [Bacteroidota bacterium]
MRQSFNKYWIVCFLILLGVNQEVIAQLGQDTILYKETTLSRPLNVHKGQLRIIGGYSMKTNTRYYDDSGNTEELSELGISSIEHNFLFGLNYGIIEYLQFTAGIIWNRHGQRGQNLFLVSGVDPSLDVSTFDEYNGSEDLYLGLDFRLPLKTRKLDWLFSVGLTLPTAENGDSQPEHSYGDIDEYSNSTKVVYHYVHNYGYGTNTVIPAMSLKYRISKFGITGYLSYRHPLGESAADAWSYQLDDNNEFIYENAEYSYQKSWTFNYSIIAEYQALSMLNGFINYHSGKSYGGWTTETGKKIADPEVVLNELLLGIELVVTPKFWIRQSIGFPLGGTNSFAPFSLNTGLSYNFFPFSK